ncbi:MAG TPA: tetratricopeptide repeat protein [Vicinamibacterales bacterium]|nr:tetratricopeptide repeat protein [Vicinamibacterales bacterium]
MGVDRESAVRKAEELVREGKTELAIDEYLRLVEDQPGDFGAANALGDLYARIGNRAAAATQFVKIGDSHRDSGFIPKAVAFYKKALKADPASEHALSQLAQIAVEQELYADATLYLNRLLQRRRDQNNEAGVAECLVRLGGFPAATADTKLAAARASAAHLKQDQTMRLWVDAADALERAGRPGEAVDVLMQAASLEPGDVGLRRRVALACAATGQIDRAGAFLSFETAGDHPDLLLALAGHALADGRHDDARRALDRVIEVAPDRRAEAEAMLAALAGESAPAPPAHQMPADLPAVEVGQAVEDVPVDLEAAFGSETDTLPVGETDTVEAPHVSTAAGDAPTPVAEEVAEEAVAAVEPAVADVEVEAVYVVPDDEPQPDAPEVVALEPEPVREPEPVPEPAPEPEPEPVREPEPEPVLEGATAAEAESIAALTAAAQNPALQFQASAQLGRLLLRLGRNREGLEWLERATQAATSAREQRLDVMYELADALERAGERARALDAFADLDFDAASFRDVPERMASLRRALEEGRAR